MIWLTRTWTRPSVFAGIFLGYAAYYLVRNNLALAIPDILREYPQHSKAELGTALTGLSIGVDARNAGFRNCGAHARDELGRMRMQDGRLVALRSLDAIERRKGLVLQHPRDGAQPVGALGVAGRGDVLKENRMRVEPCSHAPI